MTVIGEGEDRPTEETSAVSWRRTVAESALLREVGMRREVFLLVALVVVAVTLWAVFNYSAEAANIGDAIDLAKKVIGYAVFALGLGTITAQASSQGITNMKLDDVAGGASLSLIGAILLV